MEAADIKESRERGEELEWRDDWDGESGLGEVGRDCIVGEN